MLFLPPEPSGGEKNIFQRGRGKEALIRQGFAPREDEDGGKKRRGRVG